MMDGKCYLTILVNVMSVLQTLKRYARKYSGHVFEYVCMKLKYDFSYISE
jgi:hypothetical protein